MKATGIVRRIDDLGRVVIPKEIRRFLRCLRDRSKGVAEQLTYLPIITQPPAYCRRLSSFFIIPCISR